MRESESWASSALQQDPSSFPPSLRPSVRPVKWLFLLGVDGYGVTPVINALSVSLPLLCRSGAGQEEPQAGGEYTTTLFSFISSLLHLFVLFPPCMPTSYWMDVGAI